MRTAATSASELHATGRRLDASFHASDGIRALHHIHRWAAHASPLNVLRETDASYYAGNIDKPPAALMNARRLDTLAQVCHKDGIFIGGRAKRIYVTDPDKGIPFLSSSDMLMASFEGIKLISKKQPGLTSMLLEEGWTLISRSGTIGNTAYVRADMEGLAGSEHILRVVPDRDTILPGYLYAFLSSSLGNAILKSGTFGSVVDTIEPDFVGRISIPRLDSPTEQRIHDLIEEAARLRVEANILLQQTHTQLFEACGLPRLTRHEALTKGCWTFSVPRKEYGKFSLTAWTYNPITRLLIEHIKDCHYSELKDIIVSDGIYYGNQFKRIDAHPDKGVLLLSQTQVFQQRPEGRWIARNSVRDYQQFLVSDGAILVAAQGTLGDNELYGRCEFSHRRFDGCMITQHILRILADQEHIPSGYLYTFLSSEYGFQLLRSTACGTKLLGFILNLVEQLPIPRTSKDIEQEIDHLVYKAYGYRADALEAEDTAQSILAEALDLDNWVY